MSIPKTLADALKPVTLVVGHYGVGKTNFAVNLAIDGVRAGKAVTIIDMDIVNPYFRASEQRKVLEDHGVSLVAPVFAEAGTSLDVPSLTGRIAPAIERADEANLVILDVGGDDAGSIAVRRYARTVRQSDYAMLAVLNRFRNLVQDPADAIENLREIEAASGLAATALVDNSHLKDLTDLKAVHAGLEYARQLESATGLPLAAVTAPARLVEQERSSIETFVKSNQLYPVTMYVRTPWE